jgi:hypothetical protein
MKPGAVGYALIAVLLVGLVSPASASLITFGFTGSVTDVPVDELGIGVGFGSAIEGSYTFESTAADLIAGGSSASYQMAGAPYGLTVDIGGNLFGTTDSLAVNLFDAFVDQYGVLACSSDLSCSGELSIQLFFQDPTGTALGDDLLPLVPPDLTGFASTDFHLFAFVNGSELQIGGSIETLVCAEGCVVPAPEPGALVLVSTGWGLLALAGWRRRTRAKTAA